MKNYPPFANVQAPLSFHPPPATSSSAPHKGAGVSVEPTDEELLEATQEQHHPLRPPAGVQPAESPAPSSPPPPAATAAPGAATPGQEELPGPAFLPPPPHELLPESWRAALTAEQQQWIGRVLFTRDQWGRPSLITDLNLWWSPPQSRPIYHQPPASPDPFFACRLFLWMPHRIWRLQLTCPQPSCTGSMVKAGLYRTIRRVLDIDGWYLMATEYLECRRCKKKVGGWSQGIIRQLAPTYSCQFPAVLTYKLSCDHRVVTQLKSRTLGNSATQLCNTLREQHSDAWMRRAIQYLGVCEQFLALCSVRGQFPPPPQMPTLPSPIWLLTVYGYDIMTRLDEYKARITSTFGSILKMDSTKKVTKKLAGIAFDTAAWVTNVGNEYGQVLISVLTCSEGAEGLSSMAAGLMRRYRLAEVPPPQLIYVDRDCCNRDGMSKTAALFQEWGQLVVRLDIWHLMRRFAAGVTTGSHELYPAFMRQLSLCIFEVEPGDARRLTEAKRSQLEGKHGMVGLTDAEVIQKITREEWRLHCRRRTRGAEETALLIQDLLQTFGGTAGRNNLDIPLLDPLRIQDIWSTQRPHLSCIQDPPGVQLYTQTGRLTKGGVILPVYRCARGSTSLESFRLHLNRFIPVDPEESETAAGSSTVHPEERETAAGSSTVDPEESETAAGSSTGEPKDREMQTDEIDTTQDVTSTDQCAVILRYVTDVVHERLIAVVDCESSTGQYFVELLKKTLAKVDIDLRNCVGNSTDGAANMQGQYKGFSTLLSAESPNQVHIWCYAHVLNLVLGDTTGVVIASASLFSLLNDVAVFIRESYKRMNMWEEVSEDTRHRRLSPIGETRWWAKDQALSKIFGCFGNRALFIDLVSTLTRIEEDDSMKPHVRAKARGYTESLLRFETILTAQIFLRIFEITSPLSKYLQTSGMDLLTAHRLVIGTQESLNKCVRGFDEVKRAADAFVEWANAKLQEKED
ncbi:uncharacterized protein LOC117490951 [Trematomus bernacchii]|uniref:uncharacterized protein LOC117490951 n=1 Tax=Trematomus bernacchii TaxID=40690 RepID=UPI00146E238A|nr:uncharacterized protein LOC117490951 [Trematomus bernacchii]